jgi:hypothetical protein
MHQTKKHALYRRSISLELDKGSNMTFCALGMNLGPWLGKKLRELGPKLRLLILGNERAQNMI